ncbi:MAG: SMP-30/gluconolactonase/LRE family protein [Spirochaetia bacterium]|jgi:gluconolactonase|nr:SMP-30/gluconolactonase/LRE family protein [Spirochaetia bacterium]
MESQHNTIRLEKFSDDLLKVTGTSPGIEILATDFRFVEGPVWIRDKKKLIFSDIPGNALYSWSEKDGITMIRPNSYLANGNTLDTEGRLVTCEHGTSRISRTDLVTGTYSVLAESYNGKALNSPNDVIVKSDGSIYFTDPLPGRSSRVGIPRSQELSFQGVFKYDDKTSNLLLLDDSFTLPNGLCFSPDESVLFVNDSTFGTITAFDVDSTGIVINKRIWAKAEGGGEGVVDGMKCNKEGYLFCTGPGGIYIFDPTGLCLGRMILPEIAANLTWGDDERTLYVTARTSVYRIFMD